MCSKFQHIDNLIIYFSSVRTKFYVTNKCEFTFCGGPNGNVLKYITNTGQFRKGTCNGAEDQSLQTNFVSRFHIVSNTVRHMS